MNDEHLGIFERVTDHLIDIHKGTTINRSWMEGYICGTLGMMQGDYEKLENALWDWYNDMTTSHND